MMVHNQFNEVRLNFHTVLVSVDFPHHYFDRNVRRLLIPFSVLFFICPKPVSHVLLNDVPVISVPNHKTRTLHVGYHIANVQNPRHQCSGLCLQFLCSVPERIQDIGCPGIYSGYSTFSVLLVHFTI